MASQAPRHLMNRLLAGNTGLQRCGCNATAGPSVLGRQTRSLQTSARIEQGFQQAVDTTTSGQSSSIGGSQPLGTSTSRPSILTNEVRPLAKTQVQDRQASSVASTSQGPADNLEGINSSLSPAANVEEDLSARPSFSFARPKQHTYKHGNHVCTLKLSAYSDALENLTFFSQFCVHAAYAWGLPCTLPAAIPTKSSLRTVPRSPFVHKPSQENFVKKEHRRQLKIYDADVNAVGQWLDYISDNSMAGIKMKASIFESKPVGYGKSMVVDTKDMEPSEEQKVKELAESLLAAGFGEEGSQAKEQDAGEASVKQQTKAQPETQESKEA